MANLTGHTRYRADWRGRLILQVEERVQGDYYATGPATEDRFRWRDACVEDLKPVLRGA